MARAALDRDFQKSGEHIPCQVCGQFPTCWHHRKGKATEELRYDTAWCYRLCQFHHNEIHSLGERRFLVRYPLSELPEADEE